MDFSQLTSLDVKYRIIYTNGTACVRGGCFVSAYDDNLIVLKCNEDIVSFDGENLIITYMSSDEICISGHIFGISFSRR